MESTKPANELPFSRQQIEQAETKAMLAIESVALGTYEIHYETNKMITSDRFNTIWGIGPGLPREEIAHRIHPDDLAARNNAHEESLKTGNLDYEVRVIWPDNSIHWVRVKGKVVYADNSQPLMLLGIVQETTEQKLATEHLTALVKQRTHELEQKNEALKESEERYHRMVAEVEDYAILFLDRAGIIQNWNKGAEKIKGYKEEEIVGKSFKEFYLPEDRQRNLPESLIERAKQYGKAVQEGLRLRKDGTTFWGSIVITALHDTDGNVVGFSKVTRDLTERKLAEDKIHQYTRDLEFQNKELKQFAFVASHDMKEPLRKIIYNNNFLEEQVGAQLEAKVLEALHRSTNAAQRMKTLIDDILSYSQAAFAEHATDIIDLNVLLKDAIADLGEINDQNSVTITMQEMPVINGISHQIMQLFDNLLNNAIKYRHPDRLPEIAITCEKIMDHNLNEQLDEREYYKIVVTDNGIGFNKEQSEKIFELFYRLKTLKDATGSGIGLAICRKIVQNHNGFIKAHSTEGSGSSFSVYLPVEAI